MNCEYCGSKIFESDRVCDRCGAPNISKIVNTTKEERDYFGLFIQDIEKNSPSTFENSRCPEQEKIDGYFEKYVVKPLKNFITDSKDFDVHKEFIRNQQELIKIQFDNSDDAENKRLKLEEKIFLATQ